jgi:hypothetical protein
VRWLKIKNPDYSQKEGRGDLFNGPQQRTAHSAGVAVNSYTGPPMTLGNAAAARVRLIVWCKACGHQVERAPTEQTRRYGAVTDGPGAARAAGVFRVR